jgi:serine/threonine protein kinase
VVYKAVDLRNNDVVALEIMRIPQESERVSPTTLRELTVLRSLDYANCIHLRETYIHYRFDCTPSDLRKFLKSTKRRPIDPNLRRSYAYEPLCAISSLRVHRNVKPENLLIDAEGTSEAVTNLHNPVRRYAGGVVTLSYRRRRSFSAMNLGSRVECGLRDCGDVPRGPLFITDSDHDLAHEVFQISDDILSLFGDIYISRAVMPIYSGRGFDRLLDIEDAVLTDIMQKMLVINLRRRIAERAALHHSYFDNVSQIIRDACHAFGDRGQSPKTATYHSSTFPFHLCWRESSKRRMH